MNWKLLAGQTFHRLEQLALKSNRSFIRKNYPYRRNLLFDLERTLGDTRVILDIGAYTGDMSLAFHQHFKTADIYAFEPLRASFNRLQQATAGIPQIRCYPLALGATGQTLRIPVYTEASITTLNQAQYDSAPVSTEEIRVIRLDQFIREQHIKRVDILKVDVEGYEFEVLKGAGEYLSTVKCIITEVGYRRCRTKTYFTDMDRYMEENGFSLFNIYELLPEYNDRTRLFYSNNVYLNNNS